LLGLDQKDVSAIEFNPSSIFRVVSENCLQQSVLVNTRPEAFMLSSWNETVD
jgi:hypothetical protein